MPSHEDQPAITISEFGHSFECTREMWQAIPHDRIMTTEEIARVLAITPVMIDPPWPRRSHRRYIYPFTIKPDYEAPDWDTQGMETGIPTDINQCFIDDPDFLELEEP